MADPIVAPETVVEPLKQIYDGLSQKNPSLKEYGYESFAIDMKDDTNLKQVYDGLATKNPSLKEYGYDSFKGDMFGEQPKIQSSTTPDPDRWDEKRDALPEGKQAFAPMTEADMATDQYINEGPKFTEHPIDWTSNFFSNAGKAFISSGKTAIAETGLAVEDQALGFNNLMKKVSDNPSWQNYFDTDNENIKGNIASLHEFKNSAEKLTGKPGEFIGSMIPFATMAAASIALKSPALAAASTGVFAEMGYGAGIETYDEYKKKTGQPIDKAERAGAGILYGAAMSIPMSGYIGKMIPKRLFQKTIQEALSSNPEAVAGLGKQIFENFAQKSPALAKQLLQASTKSVVHGVGAMETMELSKKAVDQFLIGKNDVSWWDTIKGAAESGAAFGLMTAPFSVYAQNSANTARREAQGSVTLSKDAKGNPLELIPTKNGKQQGLTPDGKLLDVTEDQIKNSFTIPTDQFNDALSQFKKTGEVDPNIEREAYSGRVNQMTTRIADQDGNIHVATDEQGNNYYITHKDKDGNLQGVDSNGQTGQIDPSFKIQKVNKGEVWKGLMNKYDQNATPKGPGELPQGLPTGPPPAPLDPRSIAEQDARSFHSQYADQDTGNLKIVGQTTPDGEETKRWFVTKEVDEGDGNKSYLVQDGEGGHEFLTQRELTGEPLEVNQDEFVSTQLANFDQQQQLDAQNQELSNQNKLTYNGQVLTRMPEGDGAGKTSELFEDENGQYIEVPNEVVLAWEQGKQTTQDPNIVTRTYGKTQVVGTKDASGITVSTPMTGDEAESLKAEVERTTGGKSTVKTELIPSDDSTVADSYKVGIVPMESPQVAKPVETSATAPKERKIITQKIGNSDIDIAEDADFDEVVPSDKMPLEKSLPILEKKFKDNKKFKLQVEKSQVEIPGETKYDDPTYKTVIKSIKIVPISTQKAGEPTTKQAVPVAPDSAIPVNNLENNSEKLTETKTETSVKEVSAEIPTVENENKLQEVDPIAQELESKGLIVKHKLNGRVSISASPTDIIASEKTLQEAYDKVKSLRPELFNDGQPTNETAIPGSEDKQITEQAPIAGNKGAKGKGKKEETIAEIVPNKSIPLLDVLTKDKKSRIELMNDARNKKTLDTQVRYSDGVMTRRENAEKRIKKGGHVGTAEVNKVPDLSRTAFNRMDGYQQDAHEKRQREAGKKTEYRIYNKDGSFIDVTKAEYDYAKSIEDANINVSQLKQIKNEQDNKEAQDNGQAGEEGLLSKQIENIKGKVFKDEDGNYSRIEVNFVPDNTGAYLTLYDKNGKKGDRPMWLNTKGILDNIEQGYFIESPKEETKQEQSKYPNWEFGGGKQQEAQGNYGKDNKFITGDRYEELKRRMREKGNNLNSGFDPEMFAMGAEMAAYHIEAGGRKFADFAKRMIGDLGEWVKPYLSSYYEGARRFPEMKVYKNELDTTDFVDNYEFKEELPDQKNSTDPLVWAKENRDELIDKYIEKNGSHIDPDEARFLLTPIGYTGTNVEEYRDAEKYLVEQIYPEVLKRNPEAAVTFVMGIPGSGKSMLVKEHLFNGDIVYDSVMSGEDKINKLIELASGRKIRVSFIHTDPREAYNGTIDRGLSTGRFVPIPYMLKASKAYSVAVKNLREKFGNSIEIINFVRKGGNVERLPSESENFVDYNVTPDELKKVYENHPQFKNFTDEQRARIEGKAYVQKNDAGGKGGMVEPDGRSGQENVGEFQEGSIPDQGIGQEINQDNESNRQSADIHADETNMDEGQSSSIPSRALPGEGISEGDIRQSEGSDNPGDDSGGKGSGGGRDRGNGTGLSGASRGNGSDVKQKESDNGETIQPDSKRDNSVDPTEQNHIIRPDDVIVPKAEDAKIKANIKAIKLAKTLEKQNRNATPEEKKVLAQYVGWGGLAPIFKNTYWDNAWKEKYGKYYDQIQDLLSREEIATAKESTINAHYTDRGVIDAMWNMVSKMGFKGGRVLEPGAGIGHFFGLMPEQYRNTTQLRGVELDKITGLILSKLYPQAQIGVHGFENANDANNTYDLVISNVPFAGIHVYDPNNKDIAKEFTLHNYFMAKSVRLLKPGGVGVFITTSSSMDNEGQGYKFRKWMSESDGGNADLVNAIRLPNNAFKENAGTEVTTDILFFRKRDSELASPNSQKFILTGDYGEGKTKIEKAQRWGEVDKGGETVTIRVNEYYLNHPDHMLGEMRLAHEVGSGGLYSPNMPTLYVPKGFDVKGKLAELSNNVPKDVFSAQKVEQKAVLYAKEGQSEGELVTQDGKTFIVNYGELVDPGWNSNSVTGVDNKKYTKTQVVDKYKEIKKEVISLVVAESNHGETDSHIDQLRKQLNKSYNEYVRTIGTINDNRKTIFLKDDVDYSLVSSLENVKEQVSIDSKGITTKTTKITKADILDKRVNKPMEEPTSAKNIEDALDLSNAFRNGLDIPYISELLGIDAKEIESELLHKELAFRNPATGIVEDNDTYLSGWVRKKLEKAKQAAVADKTYKRNIEALERIIPKDVPLLQIQPQLGASWIPNDVVANWIDKTLDGKSTQVYYNPVTDRWNVRIPWDIERGVKNNNEFAAGGMTAEKIILSALNQQKPIIYDTNYDGTRTKNEAATLAVQEKISELKSLFIQSIWGEKGETANRIIRAYNDKHNAIVNPTVTLSGTLKYFPGASTYRVLREHQKIAVKKSLMGATLLAHQVGTGKTYTLITTAMEMKRLGIAKKPIIVVQKATTSQFVASFRKMYPNAKLLVPDKKDLEASERKRLFAKIGLNEWDAIILYHDFLTRIPDKPDRQIAYIRERIAELETVSADEEVPTFGKTDNQKEIEKLQNDIEDIQSKDKAYREENEKQTTVKDQAKRSLSRKTGLQRQFDRATDKVLYFEDMGVDALLVDEAHTFKRLGIATKGGNVKGIDTSGSQKSLSAKLKTRFILENNNNKNVVFSTGTPISNTMAEAYTMMNYLIPSKLEEHGIKTFDDFRTTFGSVEPSIEFTAAGSFKIVDRFSKYINLPELQRLWQSTADVVLTEEIGELKAGVGTPELKDGGFTKIELKMTDALASKMDEFKEILRAWEAMTGKEKRANRSVPLTVFLRAKQAAIDVRLVDSSAYDDPNSKTNKAVETIYDIYKESSSYKGAQLVFSDMVQNSDGRFNLHEEVKKKLIGMGIPSDQVQLMTDHDTDAKREKLFDKVNSGEVRVIIGSTDKMGVGVNVQQRLKAVHHLDAPARPMDFEQRNGRLIRQGNLHLQMGIPVEVLLYGVEKTLDATAYQRLAIKQRFIRQMMSKGISSKREIDDEDVDVQGQTFDQMMANLSGSQYAVMHVKKSHELRNAEIQKYNFEQKQVDALYDKQNNEFWINRANARIPEVERYIKFFKEQFPTHEITSLQIGNKKADKDIELLVKDFIEGLPKKEGETSAIINGNVRVLITYKPKLSYFGDTKEHQQLGLKINTGGNEIQQIEAKYKTFRGLSTALFESIDYLPKEIENAYKHIDTLTKRNTELDQIIESSYPDEDKISNLQKEIEELEDQMKAETSGIVAEMDKIIKDDDLTSIKEVASIPDLELNTDAAKFAYDNIDTNLKDLPYDEIEDGYEDQLSKAGLLNNYEWTDKAHRFVDLVNKRKITRMFAKLGLDLFPETSNIPEITGHEVDYEQVKFKRDQTINDEADKSTPLLNYLNKSNPKEVENLTAHLLSTGLSKEVKIVTPEEISGIIEGDSMLRKPDGTIYGFIKEGTVYLNSETLNTNTPIHEFGHLFTPVIKSEHPEFYHRGAELIKESAYYEQVKNDKNYSGLDEDAIIDEAMNQAIGDKGAKIIKEKGLFEKLTSWIKGVWARIGSKFGIKNLTPKQIEDLTLEDWTDVVNSELLSGKKLADNPISKPNGIRFSVDKSLPLLAHLKDKTKYIPFATEGKEVYSQLSEALKSTLAPTLQGPGAKNAAESMRSNLGTMQRSLDIATDKLKTAKKRFDKMSNEENIDFIDRMERGEKQPTEELQGYSDALREALDSSRERVRALGTGKLENFIENYFPHYWEDPVKASALLTGFGRRPLEGSKAFLKQRTIEFTKDGIEKGLIPVSWNPVKLALLKIREMERYTMAHATLNELKHTGYVRFVRMGNPMPEGFAKIDDKVGTVMRLNEDTHMFELLGNYYADKNAARIINNFLSKGLRGNAAYDIYRGAGNALTQFQLGLSAFHLGFTSMDAAISKQALGWEYLYNGHIGEALRHFVLTPVAPVTNIVQGDRLLKAWMGGKSTPEIQMAAEMMEKAGGRAKMDDFYREGWLDRIRENIRNNKYGSALMEVPMHLLELASKPILEYIVPRQKLGVFMDMVQYDMKVHPEYTLEQRRASMQKAWDSVDNRMGQLVYDNLFWHHVTKDVAMASVRSVGWNLGTFREVGGSGFQLSDVFMKTVHGKRSVDTHKLAYMISLVATTAISSAIYQYLRTGKGPDEPRDYFFPKDGGIDRNGDATRVSMPSYVKDLYHYGNDFPSGAANTLKNKLSPVNGIVVQMTNNKDYYGTKIWNEDDSSLDKTKEIFQYLGEQLIPFGIRNAQKNNSDKTIDKVLPFIGIVPAPFDLNMSDAEKKMSEITRGKLPVGGRTKEQADHSKMKSDLRNAYIKTQDREPLRAAVKSHDLTVKEFHDIVTDSKLSPVQRSAKRMDVPELFEVYKIATPAEKAEIKPLLKIKIYHKLTSGTLNNVEKEEIKKIKSYIQ